MTCPVCGEQAKVCNSVADVESVARQRRCCKCRYVFYTYELETDEAFKRFSEMVSDRNRRYYVKRKEVQDEQNRSNQAACTD